MQKKEEKDMERSVAIITARGGSKRILRKNIRDFCGKPILTYSIEAAMSSGVFDEVMVSTEDAEIAGIAEQYGAKVPFMRSAETADDYATTVDVLAEVLAQYQAMGREFQYACCIYPTAPFVTAEKLRHAMGCLEVEGVDSVISVTAFSFPPMRGFWLEEGEVKYAFPEFAPRRSQDISPMYHDCGQFYCFRVGRFLESKKLVTAHTQAFIVPEMEVQDIDSEQDWRLAELKYRLMREGMENWGAAKNVSQVLQRGRSQDIREKTEDAKKEEIDSKASDSEGEREGHTVEVDFNTAVRQCFLRKAKWEDMEQLFLWANEKEVRKNSFSMAPISYEEHQDWYRKKLKEESAQMYILCDGSLEVGSLRLEFDAEGAEISYSIAPEYRGRGYGKELISLAEQKVRQWAEKKESRNDVLREAKFGEGMSGKAVIKARVKPENQASKRIFNKAGYEVHAIGYQKVLW